MAEVFIALFTGRRFCCSMERSHREAELLGLSNSPLFMEPIHLLPYSEQPSNCSSLSQMHPVHTFSPYFCKIHSNIITPFTPRFPSGLFLLGILTEILYVFIASSYVLHSAHLILILIILLIFARASKLRSPSLCNTPQHPTSSCLLSLDILLSTLFSKHSQSMFFP